MVQDGHNRTAVLTAADIAEIIDSVGLDRFMDQAIEAIRTAAGDLNPETTRTIARDGFQYEKPTMGLVEWMPAMDLGRAVGIKTVGYHPSNPSQRTLPSVMATTSIYDTSTGSLAALIDATLLTAIRTGAASAVVTEIVSRPGADRLGLIGCGAQAVTQAHAISRVRPLKRIVAFDADAAVAATFARRLPVDVPVELVDTPMAAVAGADILCTATTVDIDAGPVISAEGLVPDVHINAVGADFPGKTELPEDLLRSAHVIPDDVEQCLKEGESQQLSRSDLGPTLAELVQDARHYSSWQREVTVFDSTGWALEDLVVAELALDHARRLEIGLHTQLQNAPVDPYAPYEGLSF